MKPFKLLLFLLLLAVPFFVNAQDNEDEPPSKKFNKENLFFGGNFGLSFGDYTLINISPQVGYRFSKLFAAGAGVNFIYSSFKYRYNDPSYNYRDNYGVAGLNIFGRIYPIQYVLLQAQPELNYTWGKRKFNNGADPLQLDGKIVPSLLLGAGAVIPMGGRRSGAMTFMLQYDVIQNERSPYGSKAFFNIGFNF